MKLTTREQQVMSLLLTGLSDKAIAKHMGISVRTVNAHLCKIYVKLNTTNRAAAVVAYLLDSEQIA